MNVAKRRGAKGALTDHYRRTLDDPIPALGNVSPRKAARTARGREGHCVAEEVGEPFCAARLRRPHEQLRFRMDVGRTRALKWAVGQALDQHFEGARATSWRARSTRFRARPDENGCSTSVHRAPVSVSSAMTA